MVSMVPLGFLDAGLRDARREGHGTAGYMGRRSAIGTILAGIGVLRAAAQAPLRLLVLGDSLAAGYGLPQDQGFVPRLQAALAAAGLLPAPTPRGRKTGPRIPAPSGALP